MTLKNRCAESGSLFFGSPYWKKEGETFRAGNIVTCFCGKKIKLRTPLSQGVLWTMIPHHNKGEIS